MTQARPETRARGRLPVARGNSRRRSRPASGADQTGVRVYNERLILSLVRRFGHLSKIEVARLTGLSVQSASAIMNRLQADGLLKRETPLRGRVGQPTVPVSLDPEGAFSLGLKIGRRSCDLVLIDFLGRIRSRARMRLSLSDARTMLDFVRRALPQLTGSLTPTPARRLAGLGVATPFQLWNWGRRSARRRARWTAGAISRSPRKSAALPFPGHVLQRCDLRLRRRILSSAKPGGDRDFLYFFLGSFLGGGLVLDGALYTGRTGNAGALGSMPITRARRQRLLAIDRLRIDLSARAAARGGGTRSLLDLAHA